MVKVREIEIKVYIDSYNLHRQLKINMDINVDDMPILTRDDINLEEWRMLKSFDGCGPEFLAIMRLINNHQEILLNVDEDTVINDNDDNNNNNNNNNNIRFTTIYKWSIRYYYRKS
jgi:hypothetical protein